MAGVQNWLHMFWYDRAPVTSAHPSRSHTSVRTTGGAIGPPIGENKRDDTAWTKRTPAISDVAPTPAWVHAWAITM